MMSGTRMTPISPRPPDVRRHRRTPAELVRWRSVARGPEARSNLRLDFFPVLIEHALYLPRLVLHHLRNETDLLFDMSPCAGKRRSVSTPPPCHTGRMPSSASQLQRLADVDVVAVGIAHGCFAHAVGSWGAALVARADSDR